ncbi:hypothetical protein LCGC14_2036070, partial [marine sediment metagenome]
MVTSGNVSYLAGFFDGEGSISSNLKYAGKNKRPASISLRVCAYNTDPSPIRLFHSEFGGRMDILG